MEEDFQMRFNLLQPWSTFVMRTQLPSPILEKMIKITDEIIENKESAPSAGVDLAGQIEDEFYITLDVLEREEVLMFFLNVCKVYAEQAFCQTFPNPDEINKQRTDAGVKKDTGLVSAFLFQSREEFRQQLNTAITNIWIVSQKDNEYNPTHVHTQCDLSTVMYLKIPEYLPSRKSHRKDDGAITFAGPAGKDQRWGTPTITFQPQVGDFFIFPASQQHWVYPFRTQDGRGERRSVSFNAVFSSKTEQERLKKQQEEQQND